MIIAGLPSNRRSVRILAGRTENDVTGCPRLARGEGSESCSTRAVEAASTSGDIRGHLKSAEGELGVQGGRDPPAGDEATEDVGDQGHVDEARRGPDVADGRSESGLQPHFVWAEARRL